MSANVISGSSYVIQNAKSGTVMDLSAGNNLTVTGWTDNGGSNQKWKMNWAGSGWTFQNENSNTYLGIQGTPSNGLPIGAVTQPFVWDIWHDEVNASTFRIFVPNTLQNLDLFDYGLATSGNPITLWTTWNGLHQTWNFNL